MVVLGVIVLLVASLYPSYSMSRQRANVAVVITSSNKVLHSLELYAIDHGSYPTATITAGSTNVLSSYSDKLTPWPWDHSKSVEGSFYYFPKGDNFQICWPLDPSANRAATNMSTGSISLDEGLLPDADGFAVCATASTDPVVVSLR
ncbi:prepilin-type cleavage/methylation domain-containing protein [Coprothermobacteraceae bacterium]|nr:prepilin-type cleavage/methylation domain-containing protein [Coprothermobacteraceae bacterium]